MGRSRKGGSSVNPARNPPATPVREIATTSRPFSQKPSPPTIVRDVPQQSAVPNMISMAGSSMVGSIAGSVIGHGISKSLFDNNHSRQTQPNQEARPQSCMHELDSFLRCLQLNHQDQTVCHNYLEQIRQCNRVKDH